MLNVMKDVYWIGVKDWELRTFHGEEFTAHRGTSYNSYLIQDDKTVVVDTVWTPFAQEYVAKLDKKVGLKHRLYRR